MRDFAKAYKNKTRAEPPSLRHSVSPTLEYSLKDARQRVMRIKAKDMEMVDR